MRVLVLTNHFERFGGSEIVALEVAHWFREQGDEVTLGANYASAPISAHTAGLTLTTNIPKLELQAFDLVWCQHDLLTVIPPVEFERAAQNNAPYTAVASLSPYELFEHVDAWLAKALSADVFVNSAETRDEQSRRSFGQLPASRIRVFHNAAPTKFWDRSPASPSAELKTLTVISSHIPPELVEALNVIEQSGVVVRRIGFHHDWRLVAPEDFRETDAVVTIGKSVVYAIASAKPVYMYDHFGGDGWLTRDNIEQSMAFNFSGRPLRRRLAVSEIVRELTEEFSTAANGARHLWDKMDLRLLSLDHHLTGLRERALRSRPAVRASNLRRYLKQSKFRAHLETMHAKSSIMRQSYLASQD